MKKILNMSLLVACTPFFYQQNSFAADQVGTLTQLEGTVKIFTHPGNKVEGPAPHALFEGEYYSVQDAHTGDPVEYGNIVRTAPGAKARVIFNNGDQFNVGPSTAYRVFWEKDEAKTKTQINLMYGKMRGIIEKGGPRSQLNIRTRSATMGVRGTDFFIADDGQNGTEVSVLRGEVEVKPHAVSLTELSKKVPTATTQETNSTEAKTEKKAIQVHAGFSADVTQQPSKKLDPAIELRRTSQQDLVAIQKASVILPTAPTTSASADATQKKEDTVAHAAVQKQIELLEKKAVETTLKDIKVGDPKLFEKITLENEKNKKEATSQSIRLADLNTLAVQDKVQNAPVAPKKRKPFMNELEDLEKGAYEKYFKIID